jgi:hypothetical protein
VDDVLRLSKSRARVVDPLDGPEGVCGWHSGILRVDRI